MSNYTIESESLLGNLLPWGNLSWTEPAVTTAKQNEIVDNFRQGTSATTEAENISSGLLDWSLSSTVETPKPEVLTEEIQQIFFAAREEVFEDGMDSVFSGRLVNFMRRHNRLAIDILSDLLILEQVNAEVAGEALRHVGYLEHTPTHISRRRLLEHCLFGSSARIRDGAILGIAAMDDARATLSVKRAINRETIPELKRDMNAVLEQLCETKNKV